MKPVSLVREGRRSGLCPPSPEGLNTALMGQHLSPRLSLVAGGGGGAGASQRRRCQGWDFLGQVTMCGVKGR